VGLECYRIGDLVLDAGTQEVKRDGTIVPIPRLSFKLLLALARHAPNVVSAQQLENEVWEGLVVDRGTVNKRVLLLRKALDEGRDGDPYIAVVRGSGYRLVVPVERIDSAAVEIAGEVTAEDDLVRAKTRTIRRTSYLIAGIVITLALYHGSLMTISKFRQDTPAIDTPAETVPSSQNSIAVLPFLDLMDGQTRQYLGDGIAEEIINLLTRIDGLDIAARTSSFAFRDSGLTAMEIASRLRVAKILEGSVRYTGERLRITAQLIDVQTGYHIWSQNYDRVIDDVFEIQDDIAASIAESLKLTLDENSKIDSRTDSTGNLVAFDLYLQGRELLNNRISLREEGLHEALGYFTEAVAEDPGFARAHAGIALASRLLISYDDTLDREAYVQSAETSANLALQLNPRSTDALSALALVYESRNDIINAHAMYEKIRAIGSIDSNALHWEAMLHIRLGYFDEVIGPLARVYELEPLNEHIGWSLATALNFAGDPAAARKILKQVESFSYRQYVLGLCAINVNHFDQARELLRDVKMRSGILPATWADSIIDGLENPARSEEVALGILAAVEQGELSRIVAFEALLILGSPRVWDLGIDPLGDIIKLQIHTQVWNNWAVAVRRDPRFKEWVTALGAAEFWEKYGWPDRCKPAGQGDFECI